MRIDRVELYHVAMPLISPWRTAYGEDYVIHSVLCRLVSGSVDGWGESSPLGSPTYSPEWAGGIFATTRQWLASQILGKEINSGRELQERISLYKGNSFAKALLDNAWWELHSRIQNKPLHQLLGATREHVSVGADFGVADTVDELVGQMGEAIAEGFPRIKLKYRPGWDVPMLREVRKHFPDHPIHIDCNSGYTLQDVDMFKELDEFHLQMIEQPLAHDDLTDHAALQAQIDTPICLDESLSRPRRLEQAIALNSCRVVNIKPGRVGGLTNAVTMHNHCQQHGIPCWVGGMLESAIGSSHCAALAMLDNFTYPGDIFPTSRFYELDLAEEPLELVQIDGVPHVAAPERVPNPHPDRLAAWTVQQAILK